MLKPIAYDGGPEITVNGWIFYDENNQPLPNLEGVHNYEIKYTGSKWVVVEGRNFILDKIEEAFVFNSSPSYRADDWDERVKFDTAEEASEFLEAWKIRNLTELRKNPIFKLWGQSTVPNSIPLEL